MANGTTAFDTQLDPVVDDRLEKVDQARSARKFNDEFQAKSLEERQNILSGRTPSPDVNTPKTETIVGSSPKPTGETPLPGAGITVTDFLGNIGVNKSELDEKALSDVGNILAQEGLSDIERQKQTRDLLARRIEEKRPERLAQAQQSASTIFSPERSALRRSQTAAEREQGLIDAKLGTARGSRSFERGLIREDIAENSRRAIAEKERLMADRLLAEAEGADAKTLAGFTQRINAAQAAADEQRQKLNEIALGIDETSREQQFELDKITLNAQIDQLPSFKEKQDTVIAQLQAGGEEFINSLSEQELTQLEEQGGFTKGFLKTAAGSTFINADPGNEFTFTAPKLDDFGQVISPGYIFDKRTGMISVVDPGTGNRVAIPGGSNALASFKSFDEYAAKTGNGNIVSGSPYHKGFEVDIDGKIGDPVLSFSGGKVVEAEQGDSGFGNTVVVETPDGQRVRYAHLDSIAVRPGQQVGAGTFLGGMGNTGSTIPLGEGDGSHLHIEARDMGGNLVSLDKIPTFTQLQGFNSPTPLLLAEAASKGYFTKQEQQSYLAAKKQGIVLPDKINEMLPNEKFKAARELGKEFQAETKGINTTLINIDKLNASIELLKEDIANGKGFGKLNPVSQAVIIGFNKMLDPGSVVRESEYNRVGEGQSVVDQMQGTIQNWVDGGAKITPENLQEFVDVSNSWSTAYTSDFRDKGQRFQYIAGQGGLDEDIIFTPESLKLINSVGDDNEFLDAGVSFYNGGELSSDQDFSGLWDSL